MTRTERITALENKLAACEAEISCLKTELWQVKSSPEPVKWPVWVPKPGHGYYYVNDENESSFAEHTRDVIDEGRIKAANVYRTEAEAAARCELNKHLAIHAMLRQLGGGESGDYGIRFGNIYWRVVVISAWAPGEARFSSQESAEAALAALKSSGILKDGEVK